MPGETPFDTEARVIDQARAATGEITATATCACGREIHVTVALPARDIEAAVKRVLLGMQRDAMQWAAHRAPIRR